MRARYGLQKAALHPKTVRFILMIYDFTPKVKTCGLSFLYFPLFEREERPNFVKFERRENSSNFAEMPQQSLQKGWDGKGPFKRAVQYHKNVAYFLQSFRSKPTKSLQKKAILVK